MEYILEPTFTHFTYENGEVKKSHVQGPQLSIKALTLTFLRICFSFSLKGIYLIFLSFLSHIKKNTNNMKANFLNFKILKILLGWLDGSVGKTKRYQA